MVAGKFVPVRFLSIMSHFIIVVTMFWALDSNLKSCLPLEYTTADYDTKHTQLTVGLSVTVALFAVELLSFLTGMLLLQWNL